MKRVNHRGMIAAIVAVCLSALGCPDVDNGKPAATGQTQSDETTATRGLLEDGVYPVVLADEALPKGDPEIEVESGQDHVLHRRWGGSSA